MLLGVVQSLQAHSIISHNVLQMLWVFLKPILQPRAAEYENPSVYALQCALACVCECVAEKQSLIRVKLSELRSHQRPRDLCSSGSDCH